MGEHQIKIRLHKELTVDVKVVVKAAAVARSDAEAAVLLAEEPEPIGFGSMDEY